MRREEVAVEITKPVAATKSDVIDPLAKAKLSNEKVERHVYGINSSNFKTTYPNDLMSTLLGQGGYNKFGLKKELQYADIHDVYKSPAAYESIISKNDRTYRRIYLEGSEEGKIYYSPGVISPVPVKNILKKNPDEGVPSIPELVSFSDSGVFSPDPVRNIMNENHDLRSTPPNPALII
jgi:hypothetical protein